MTGIRIEQTPENYNKYIFGLNHFFPLGDFFHGCDFYLLLQQ